MAENGTAQRFITTWEWWGRPKYGWRFRVYRTAKGGITVVFGAGRFTVRYGR